jgi:molybdate transport system substrate-binding protein
LACAVVLSVTTLTLTGCGDGDPGPAGSATAGSGLDGSITVSAAASLRDAITEIGDGFVRANDGVEVTYNFDASSSLAAQIAQGAPADVFASADEATMYALVDDGLVTGAETFARNELVIVTKPGNPEGIGGLADLARAGVIALCGQDAPCGRYAHDALDEAGVDVAAANITRGQNARATLTAVSEADAVAGVVYATDAIAAGDAVEVVPVGSAGGLVAIYLIGVVDGNRDRDVAEAFLARVLGDEGQAVLEEHGFSPAG